MQKVSGKIFAGKIKFVRFVRFFMIEFKLREANPEQMAFLLASSLEKYIVSGRTPCECARRFAIPENYCKINIFIVLFKHRFLGRKVMGIKRCSANKSSDCPCSDYNEYEIRLKCIKTKLHSRYIAFIAVGIVVWVLATGEANSPEFSNWISFASTITSIILSVIAIILSITGESKTDAMRNQMEETARKLEETATAISNANERNKRNVEELKENIDLLGEKIEELKGNTVEVLNRYEKTERQNNSIINNISRDLNNWLR